MTKFVNNYKAIYDKDMISNESTLQQINANKLRRIYEEQMQDGQKL